MKQWMLPASAAAPADLFLNDVAVPEPGPGQVRLRVRAVSLNARDQMIVRGEMGRLPGVDVVPLSDVAGEIVALGPGSPGSPGSNGSNGSNGSGSGGTEWVIGDRVMTAHVPQWVDGPAVAFGVGPGSMNDAGVGAEFVIVDAAALVRSPANLSDAEASTLQVAGVTAWNAMFGAHPVTSGDKVLVIGSGGVSLYAAQIAVLLGAEVYAAVRSQAHSDQWTDLGVAEVITTHEPGWGGRVKDLSGGVTKVVNTVGPGIINECLASLGGSGEVAVLGLYDLNAPALDNMTLIASQASIRGVAVGSKRMHQDLSDFITKYDLHPVIDETVDFTELPKAFELQAKPNIFGKVVLTLT